MTKKEKRMFSIMAFIILIALGAVLIPRLLQNDTFYTIKIGNYILKNGIDMKDHWSLIANLPYCYPHWLFDCLVAISYNIFGFNGVYIFTMLLSGLLSFTIYEVITREYKEPFLSLIISLTITFFMIPFLTARAQIMTYALFVLFVHFINRFLETKKFKYFIYMFIIGILVANLHAAVWPLIFILFLPYFAEWILSFIFKENNRLFKKKFSFIREPNTKYLFIAVIIMIISGFITPIGSTPFLYSIKIFLGNTTAYIHEHSLSVFNSTFYTLALMVPLFLFLIFSKQKMRFRDFFMIIGLMTLAIMSRRHTALILTIGMIFISKYIINYAKRIGGNLFLLAAKKAAKLKWAIIISIVFVAPYIPLFVIKFNTHPVNAAEYPAFAVNFLLDHYQKEDIRVFNDYNFGSYLMFRDLKVTTDSRSDLYTKPFNKTFDYFDEYINFDQSGYKDYKNYFEKYNINFIIVKNNSYINLQVLKDPDYHLIYSDDTFRIIKKKESK